MSASEHLDHGSTPAAWTGVIIIIVAFAVSTLALVLDNWPMFWVGVVLVPVGALAGKILALKGYGKVKRVPATDTSSS